MRTAGIVWAVLLLFSSLTAAGERVGGGVAASDGATASALFEKGEAAFREADYAKARGLYSQAADLGDAAAENRLGDLYFDGKGVTRDYGTALKHYRGAAEKGLARALCNAGYMYDYGIGVTEDFAVAVRYYSRAIELGHAEAMYHFAIMVEQGRASPRTRFGPAGCTPMPRPMVYWRR